MQVKPKPGDFFVLLMVIASALLILFFSYQRDTEEKFAVIIQDGKVLERIRLDRIDKKITIPYPGKYPGIIEAEQGRIRFKEAQCPDKVCVKTGWISKTGQIAVCLPDNIIIKIEGAGNQDDTDILLR